MPHAPRVVCSTNRGRRGASAGGPRGRQGPAGPRRWWSPLALVIAFLALAALVACGGAPAGQGAAPASGAAGTDAPAPAAAFPVTLTDDDGRTVTLARMPGRIVSVAPSNTEILFALGLGDRVVGVTTFCDYPAAAAAKPKIGGLRPNLEAIVAQQPDLVLGIRGTPPDVIAALEGQQIAVAILNPVDFAGVLANLRAIGRLTGTAPAAERLTGEMDARWKAVEARARGASGRPRVLYEIDSSDPAAISAAGPGTFIDAMITASGGVNVLSALTPGQQYPRIGAEAILGADPDLILIGDAPFGQTKAVVAARPGWDALRAVQRGALVEIDDPNVTSRPGPRLVEGLELVARAIHPEVFGAAPPPATPPPPVRTPAG
jgi:iron complex transport system substrate-binding protein